MTLNANQKRAIAAFLNCGELRKAAKETGIAESTIYRWVNEDEDFKAALDQALGEAIKAAVLMLAGNGAKVAEALMEIIEDKDENIHARLKTIDTYYKYFPTLTDITLGR